MTKSMSAAAVAACLIMAGGLTAHASESTKSNERLQLAQQNSPGDGLDSDAASDGNGRPNKMRGAKKKTSKKNQRG